MPIGQVPALQEDPSEGQDDTIPIHFIYIYCEYNYYLNPAITTARQDQLLLELLAVLMACSVEAAVVLGCSAFWAWVHGVRGCNERIVCVLMHVRLGT